MGHDLSCKSKRDLSQERLDFPAGSRVRVREERKRRAKIFLPGSTEFHRSKFVGLRTKVHRIDEGYAWVPKMRDFAEDPNEEFRKSKVSGLGSVHKASKGFFYALRGREFFLLGLFSIFGMENGRIFEFLSSILCLGKLYFA